MPRRRPAPADAARAFLRNRRLQRTPSRRVRRGFVPVSGDDAVEPSEPRLYRRRVHSVRIARTATKRRARRAIRRSEEHTSELQSHVNLVCRLLLEKKKNTKSTIHSLNKNKKDNK